MERPYREIFLALLIAVTSPLTAQTYAIAPADGAEIRLKVYKTGFMRGKVHHFVFERYSGEIEFDAQFPEKSTVKLSIESNSIVCEDDWVSAKDLAKIQAEGKDKILRADQYPRLTFHSTEIRKLSADEYVVAGDLKIRDRSEPSEIEVVMRTEGSDLLRFDGIAVVDLKDYGIKPPSALFGAVGTRNQMDIAFHLTARRLARPSEPAP